MKKRIVLKMLKITANLKTGILETLTANRILTRRKITAKKKPIVEPQQRNQMTNF